MSTTTILATTTAQNLAHTTQQSTVAMMCAFQKLATLSLSVIQTIQTNAKRAQIAEAAATEQSAATSKSATTVHKLLLTATTQQPNPSHCNSSQPAAEWQQRSADPIQILQRATATAASAASF